MLLDQTVTVVVTAGAGAGALDVHCSHVLPESPAATKVNAAAETNNECALCLMVGRHRTSSATKALGITVVRYVQTGYGLICIKK